MSDGRLRELERRWKESGSVDDGAAWLRARLRAGTIDRDRLLLAAYMGSPIAISAAPDKTPASVVLPKTLRQWSQTIALEFGGWRVAAWILSAALQEVMSAWTGALRAERPGDPAHTCVRVLESIAGAADSGNVMDLHHNSGAMHVLLTQHAAREQMWNGGAQDYVAHLHLRAGEIVTLRRAGHTGVIIDHCAQAISRLRKVKGKARNVRKARSDLRKEIRAYVIPRALNTEGTIRGVPDPEGSPAESQSVAIGQGAVAVGNNSFAVGEGAIAVGHPRSGADE